MKTTENHNIVISRYEIRSSDVLLGSFSQTILGLLLAKISSLRDPTRDQGPFQSLTIALEWSEAVIRDFGDHVGQNFARVVSSL